MSFRTFETARDVAFDIGLALSERERTSIHWLAAFAILSAGCEVIAGYDHEPVADDAGFVPATDDSGIDDSGIDDSTACSAPRTRCLGVCTDLSTDFDHCGSCDRTCAVGASCIDSVCACPSGQLECSTTKGAACIDPKTEHDHCGGCDTKCPTDATCMDGTCVCGGGKTLCSGACVDTTTDPANCASCGNACAKRGVCVASVCGCPSKSTLCGDTCVATDENAAACGDCTTRCRDDEQCLAGACTCRPGLLLCGGVCVDPESDPANCGGCAKSCGTGACNGGGCKSGCTGTYTQCALATGKACIKKTGALDCGGCGIHCAANEVCAGSTCRSYAPAAGCTSCPCTECETGTKCCSPPPGHTKAICVTGTTCPSF